MDSIGGVIRSIPFTDENVPQGYVMRSVPVVTSEEELIQDMKDREIAKLKKELERRTNQLKEAIAQLVKMREMYQTAKQLIRKYQLLTERLEGKRA